MFIEVIINLLEKVVKLNGRLHIVSLYRTIQYTANLSRDKKKGTVLNSKHLRQKSIFVFQRSSTIELSSVVSAFGLGLLSL